MGSLLSTSHMRGCQTQQLAPYKNKTRTCLFHFSKGERNNLKVTLKLSQEAQMGLSKRKEVTFFSLRKQLTDCRTVGGEISGGLGGRLQVGHMSPEVPGHLEGLSWLHCLNFIKLSTHEAHLSSWPHPAPPALVGRKDVRKSELCLHPSVPV